MPAPEKGAPNGAETRCNARLWQGRMGVNFSAVTRVVPAKAGTHTPRLIGKAMGPVAFVTIRAGGYGSLLWQGRHHFYFWGRLATTKQKARARPPGLFLKSLARSGRGLEQLRCAGLDRLLGFRRPLLEQFRELAGL